jgi:hypothetical protein
MKTRILLILLVTLVVQSCSFTITREEEDLYTVVNKDTVETHFIKNAPGNVDRGVVHPSTKEILRERDIAKYDSTVNRFYPDFIRLGLFEGMGFIGGDTDFSLNSGLLGIHPNADLLYESSRGGGSGSIFTGGIYRIGIYENRLRWFRDAPDWTWGVHGFEAIVPDARAENSLTSMLTPYIRKRFYFRDDIPYLSATIAVGLGYYPSQYINVSGSLDLGSIGGLNLRAYVGMASGYNSATTPQISNNDFAEEGIFSTLPYAGLSVSVLDFVNRVPELYTEWKDHEHSSWNIGIAELTVVNTNSEYSYFGSETEPSDSPISGMIFKFANANVAIPIEDNYNFYAGTSLISMYLLGQNGNGIGILPIRIGYWHQLMQDELSVDPYAEFGYYPSSYYDVGVKLRLRFSERYSVALNGGYISGRTLGGINSETLDFLGDADSFSGYYIGLSFGLGDRIFFPEELRYDD